MSEAPQSRAKPDRAGFVIAGLLALLAGVLVWDASRINAVVTYGMGPEATPVVIAIGLGILAIANFADAMRGKLPPRDSADPLAVWLILGGMAALIAIIGFGGGFIPAATVLFVATSTAFGRRAIVTDLIIALVLTTLIYLAFDKLLTLSLPAGPLERLF